MNKTPALKRAVESGNLIAFADDLFIMADSQLEAKLIIKEFEKVRSSGLTLNKDKTQILSDLKEMEGVEEIEGIKVSKKIKYLGMTLSCDRKALVKDAKNQCQRYLMAIKGKI